MTTTKRKRNDIHSPSNIRPEEYEFVGVVLTTHEELYSDRQIIIDHMKKTGGHYSTHDHGGFCDVCGNTKVLNYAVFYHRPTNTYIKTGLECADTISSFASNKLDDAIKQAQKLAYRQRQYEKKERERLNRKESFINSLKGTIFEQFAKYIDEYPSQSSPRELFILTDILRRGADYGGLTDKQMAFATRLVTTLTSPKEKPVREIEPGKQQVRGKILSLSYKSANETSFPGYKMTLIDEFGRKYYCTAPNSLLTYTEIPEDIIGYDITIFGEVIKSDRDPSFGFIKRPRLMSVNNNKQQ